MDGYQLIDLDLFEERTSKLDEEMIILFLTWIIEKVKNSYDPTNKCEIEIVLSTYNHSNYPVIGVKYFSDNLDEITDIEPIIQAEAENVINNHSVSDLLHFISENHLIVKSNKEKIVAEKLKAKINCQKY